MGRLHNIFKKLDELLFAQVDKLRVSLTYQKITDQLITLNEKTQKIVNQLTALFIIIIPLFIVCVVLLGNCSIRSENKIKKEILVQLQLLSSQKHKVAALGQQTISTGKISSKNELQERLKSIMEQRGIDLNRVKINKFNQSGPGKSITTTDVKLGFSNFSITDLSNFLLDLLEQEKVKITGLNINRIKDASLAGDIMITHYGKNL